MEQKTKLVIFDLDGTLLDTIGDLGNSANRVLAAHGLPQHTIEEYYHMVGNGLRMVITRALPADIAADEKAVDAYLDEYRAEYSAHIDDFTRPYEGIVELVNRLNESGYKLAVASNKFQAGTEKLVGEFFPGIPFVAVLGDCKEWPLKPDPAMLRIAMERASVAAAEAVMVGDTAGDIKAALAAGVRCITVPWGFRSRAELTAVIAETGSSAVFASSPEDIYSLIGF